jgi:hypothetical protein
MSWRRLKGEWRYSSTILDLSTRWSWVLSFTPGRFTPTLGKDPPGTHWTGGQMGLRAGLDTGGIEPRPLSPSLYRLSYCTVTYLINALPGSSSVNSTLRNSRGSCVFRMSVRLTQELWRQQLPWKLGDMCLLWSVDGPLLCNTRAVTSNNSREWWSRDVRFLWCDICSSAT